MSCFVDNHGRPILFLIEMREEWMESRQRGVWRVTGVEEGGETAFGI